MLKVIFLLLGLAALTLTVSSSISPSLLETLKTKGSSANIIIRMTAGTQKVLSNVNTLQIADRASRLSMVANALKVHAAETQKEILTFLSAFENLTYHSIWISNKIFIANADASLVEKLSTFAGISEIHEEFTAYLEDNLEIQPTPERTSQPLAESNIELIQAHYTWSILNNNGTGAIVANIDTGVRSTHDVLSHNFVGDYGWFDAVASSLVPVDLGGGGTGSMGVIAGSNGIGVAPGAKYMACKACSSTQCLQSNLELCAQFIACPTLPDGTEPDCSKAPHVVSNSWIGTAGSQWANPFIEAWKVAGIVPVFANGNSGPNCGTVGSPADSSVGVIAVGTTKASDEIYETSSMGPSLNGQVKPDIVAPGNGIRCPAGSGNTYYDYRYGSGMAAPHVAGVVALLVAENQDLSYEEFQKYLFDYTDRALNFPGRNCGGISETTFPNNAFGWGRLNAYRSVRALRNSLKV